MTLTHQNKCLDNYNSGINEPFIQLSDIPNDTEIFLLFKTMESQLFGHVLQIKYLFYINIKESENF